MNEYKESRRQSNRDRHIFYHFQNMLASCERSLMLRMIIMIMLLLKVDAKIVTLF